MNDKIMSVVFAGHGSPMVALDNNEITEGMAETGHRIIE
jgi:4,5-DOPA dioxygenase extradiol